MLLVEEELAVFLGLELRTGCLKIVLNKPLKVFFTLKIFRKFTPIKLIATLFSSRFIGLMLLADCLIHGLLMSIPADLIDAFLLFADFATDSSFFHTENICSLLCNF